MNRTSRGLLCFFAVSVSAFRAKEAKCEKREMGKFKEVQKVTFRTFRVSHVSHLLRNLLHKVFVEITLGLTQADRD